jgi:hypothetical protein
MKIHNTHIHTFTDQDVPDKFLPLHLVQLLRTKVGSKVMNSILKHLIPFTNKDVFDRYSSFITTGRLGSQANILHNVLKEYPEDVTMWSLTMDMAFMGAGKVPRDYDEQLHEICELKRIYKSNLQIFVHIDPRREGQLERIKRLHIKYGIAGIKMYPPLGYYPYDERLYPILCELKKN